MNAICLIIDGLGTPLLGPYGAGWVETPAFNRLAADGIVFDQAYVDSPRLESLYRSLWTASHALVKPACVPAATLGQRLSAAGIQTMLVTDDRLVGEHPSRHFDESLVLRPATSARGEASDINRTEAAQFFAAAIDQLAKLRDPFLLWVHAGGFSGVWDAPWALRERYLSQEDASEVNLAEKLASIRQPPSRADFVEEPDPDDLLALRMAYAAQLGVLDVCISAWLQALDETALADSTLLVVLGARGYPLGQHGHVGHQPPSLHEELIHIPWLIRPPAGQFTPDRINALVQPHDLPATLLDWFDVETPPEKPPAGQGRSVLPFLRHQTAIPRDRLLITDEALSHAIRTPAWYLIRDLSKSSPPAELAGACQLYVKPDDRFEINEVSSRCAEVVTSLNQALTELEQAVAENRTCELAPFDPGLNTHSL